MPKSGKAAPCSAAGRVRCAGGIGVVGVPHRLLCPGEGLCLHGLHYSRAVMVRLDTFPPVSSVEGATVTTFALVRHGQTDWNAERRLMGSTDIPLNDVGRAQARDAVAALSAYEWDAIVSSPLSRAAETADLIAAGLGLSVVRRVPELAERSFGPAEGLQPGPELDALRIPGGFRGAESKDAAARRGLTALEALAAEFRGCRVLAVSHGTLIRLSLCRAIGQTLPHIDPAALNLAHHAVGGWQVEYINGEPVMAGAHA